MHTRRPTRSGWVAALVSSALIAGCQGSSDPPQPAASSAPSVAPARYTALKSGCPVLASDVAKEFGAAGEGRPAGTASPLAGVSGAQCSWQPSGTRPSVGVTVSIYANGFAPTDTGEGNAKHLFDGLRDDAGKDGSAGTSATAQSSEWGPTFVTANPSLDSVTQTTLASNAVITVVVYDRDRFTDNEAAERQDLLRRLGPALRTLTGEVVDDLR
jgi:hypothetical protein